MPSRGSVIGLRQAGPDGSDVAPVAASTTRKWSGVSERTEGSASVGQRVLTHAARDKDAKTAMLKIFIESPICEQVPVRPTPGIKPNRDAIPASMHCQAALAPDA